MYQNMRLESLKITLLFSILIKCKYPPLRLACRFILQFLPKIDDENNDIVNAEVYMNMYKSIEK